MAEEQNDGGDMVLAGIIAVLIGIIGDLVTRMDGQSPSFAKITGIGLGLAAYPVALLIVGKLRR
jgi:hypothetical protein